MRNFIVASTLAIASATIPALAATDKISERQCKANPHCKVVKPDSTNPERTNDAVRAATLGHKR